MKEKDIPAYVRKCYQEAKQADKDNRDKEIERLNFYVGGDLQWNPTELTARRGQQRPIVTINKCKPPVDQVEGDIRINPPGPQVYPVGAHGDSEVADIFEGLILETEFRSNGQVAYSTAGRYVAASGRGYIELETEWANDRSFEQRLRINSVEDPGTIFFDPKARRSNKEDAMWAGKMKMYSKEEYTAKFGSDSKVLQPGAVAQAMGWIADAMGTWGLDGMSDLNVWTGSGKGPYYVCEFYMVEFDQTKLRAYSDGVCYFDDDKKIPETAKRLDGEENVRMVGRRKVCKYVVDAYEVKSSTDWLGRLIPLFPVLGPEVWIDGKLHRLSLISGAMDAQRALNYAATTMVELVGFTPRAPWIGPEGTFDDPRWKTANTEMWAYLEYTPVYVTDEATGTVTLAPPPQRNMWEAAIQWILALKASFVDDIKAVTNTYDPSLGASKGNQSGKAIEQLRSESNVGNFSYADNLHRAIGNLYSEMIYIFPQILDGPRVVSIVRPDSQHETVAINQMFGKGDEGTGANKKKELDITKGEYAVRATVGQSHETARREALEALTEFFKGYPQALQAPGMASNYLRLIGDGNNQIEQMADNLEPEQGEDADLSPEQMQAKLQQAKSQIQALTMVAQKMHETLQAGLPKVEADKWKAMLDSITKIRVAEISASKDLDKAAADRDANLMEQQLLQSHQAATAAQQQDAAAQQQRAQQQHEQGQQQSDQAHAAASQASDQTAASMAQLSDQQAAAAQQEAQTSKGDE